MEINQGGDCSALENLPDELFIKIIHSFEFSDLFNFALSSMSVIPAAQEVYKLKFGFKVVTINECGDWRPHLKYTGLDFPNGYIEQYDTLHHLYGFMKSLQYIRCFGGVIEKLSINYGVN